MHLNTEEPAASRMLELFREVGGDVPEYFHRDFFFFFFFFFFKDIPLTNVPVHVPLRMHENSRST